MEATGEKKPARGGLVVGEGPSGPAVLKCAVLTPGHEKARAGRAFV